MGYNYKSGEKAANLTSNRHSHMLCQLWYDCTIFVVCPPKKGPTFIPDPDADTSRFAISQGPCSRIKASRRRSSAGCWLRDHYLLQLVAQVRDTGLLMMLLIYQYKQLMTRCKTLSRP